MQRQDKWSEVGEHRALAAHISVCLRLKDSVCVRHGDMPALCCWRLVSTCFLAYIRIPSTPFPRRDCKVVKRLLGRARLSHRR
jgi:hypothetical protein